MTPCIAVLTTCYNDGDVLATSLYSMLSQVVHGTELELVLVNNGSTDRTFAIAERMRAEDHRLRVLHLPANISHPAAINLAARHTTAPWLVVHNADDWAAQGYLAAILDVAAARPDVNCIFSPWQWFGARTDVQRFPPYCPARI